MKVVDALRIVQQPAEGAYAFSLFLACGFTPMHLETFLKARLRDANPKLSPVVHSGLFGDCFGNVERIARGDDFDAAVIAMEWSDLDPRLGIRQLGGWSPDALADILATTVEQMQRFEHVIARAAEHAPLALSLPTLPLPPLIYVPGWHASTFELELRQLLAASAARLARVPGVSIVNQQRLDLRSAAPERLDVAAELRSGFPYRIAHASALAELLVQLIHPPEPKKGLITDLDDTLWGGLVGEVGHTGVSWSLNDHTHTHGLYQQLLGSLADAGVLVAIASKNDPTGVEHALERDDLVVRKDQLFPIEVSWGAKSAAVTRILRTWNIGAQSVVFVDDSPLELAEVKAVHPQIECLQFDAKNEQATFDLLVKLRDLFGKRAITQEDFVRMQSLRNIAHVADAASATLEPAHAERFLAAADAELTVSFAKDYTDPRPLELVNKTNQFNLNGRRQLEAEWQRSLKDAATFALVVGYRDKYGPLGKIGVLCGRCSDDTLLLDTWVMSCRAFARRIEFRCLELLFDKFGVAALELDFEPTAKNGPLCELLNHFGLPTGMAARLHLPRTIFAQKCPPLYHRLQEPAS